MVARRLRSVLALGVAVGWGCGAAAGTLTWGSLCTGSGPSVMDWMVQDWIDDYFQDGTPGNGTVSSDIVVVGTACYSGDFADNFNSTTGDPAGGGAFDTAGFTNATTMSANQAGGKAVYGGFDNDAAKALKPGATTNGVFNAGTAGRAASETPQSSGANKPIGGANSTHVLVWAGKPNGEDRSQINDIHNNFAGNPNTTVTVLAGDGSQAQGGPHVSGAATLDGLKNAIQSIGSQMAPGEQFVFYVGDHGNIEKINVPDAPATQFNVAPGGVQQLVVPVEPFILADMLNDPGNAPTIELYAVPSAVPPHLVRLDLHGVTIGTLATAQQSVVYYPPLGAAVTRYQWNPPESFFDIFTEIDVRNEGLDEFAFFAAGMGSGDIAKLGIPEPGALALMALAVLGACRRRRS